MKCQERVPKGGREKSDGGAGELFVSGGEKCDRKRVLEHDAVLEVHWGPCPRLSSCSGCDLGGGSSPEPCGGCRKVLNDVQQVDLVLLCCCSALERAESSHSGFGRSLALPPEAGMLHLILPKGETGVPGSSLIFCIERCLLGRTSPAEPGLGGDWRRRKVTSMSISSEEETRWLSVPWSLLLPAAEGAEG